MALDFEVPTEDGSSVDIVSLGIKQHDELMNLASSLHLPQLLRFENYFEEVGLALTELPQLSEELSIIKKAAPVGKIAEFARDLDALIVLAANRKQPISAIPD
jgi:hypothetical protein